MQELKYCTHSFRRWYAADFAITLTQTHNVAVRSQRVLNHLAVYIIDYHILLSSNSQPPHHSFLTAQIYEPLDGWSQHWGTTIQGSCLLSTARVYCHPLYRVYRQSELMTDISATFPSKTAWDDKIHLAISTCRNTSIYPSCLCAYWNISPSWSLQGADT